MVDMYLPETLDEAVSLLRKTGGIPIAGGTDLMVRHRGRPGCPPSFERPLVLVGRLKELQEITFRDDACHIGAGVNLATIIKDTELPESLRVSVAGIGSPGIRNLATVAGNICNASPAADSLPALYCLDASIRIIRNGAVTTCPLPIFITGPGKTSLNPGDLVTDIIIPRIPRMRIVYRKVGTRRANALSKLSFLGMYRIEDHRITDIRIAFGAVSPRVLRIPDLERQCLGKSPQEVAGMYSHILASYAEGIRPIDDQRSSARYRKRTALHILEDFLTKELVKP